MSDAPGRPESERTETHDKRARLAETRKIVKLALDDGWSEAEIARRCRVDADKVAAWKNGKERARRHELQPLIDAFGWRLSRQKARVYLVVDPEAAPKWDDSEQARTLRAAASEMTALEERHAELLQAINLIARHVAINRLQATVAEKVTKFMAVRDAQPDPAEPAPPTEARRHYVGREMAPAVSMNDAELTASRRILAMTDDETADLTRLYKLREQFPYNIDGTIKLTRAHFEETHHLRPALIGGRVVFAYLIAHPAPSIGRDPRLRREPVARWVVHHLGADRFILVRQKRRTLSAARTQRWKASLEQASGAWRLPGTHAAATLNPEFVDAPDDAARWLATIEPPMTLAELLTFADAAIADPDRPHGPNDEVSLPFLLRKALIEQRFDVPGVVLHGLD